MTIPIEEIKCEIEKNAGAISSTVKAMWSHPKAALAILGTGAAGLGALSVADKIHDAYNITSEMRKRKAFNDQSNILIDILESQKKLEPAIVSKNQKLKIEPLY